MALTEMHKVFVKQGAGYFRLEVRMKDGYKFQCNEMSIRWIELMKWINREVQALKKAVRDALESIGYKWIEIYKCNGEHEDECMIRLSKDGCFLIGTESGNLHATITELAEEKLKAAGFEIEENGYI